MHSTFLRVVILLGGLGGLTVGCRDQPIEFNDGGGVDAAPWTDLLVSEDASGRPDLCIPNPVCPNGCGPCP